MTRETANDVHRLVTGVGCAAEAFRVGLQSDPGGAAQGSHEGRLTTARETMSTAWIEICGCTSKQPESVSEVGEKKG